MNFYQYLGIKQTASPEDIRKAFRKMAKVTHPDYNKKNDAFWEMVELNIIRDTLLSPNKRKKYDESLLKGTSDHYSTNSPSAKSTPKHQTEQHPLYKSVKNLFMYHCKVCGHEMTSTWKGYCLYHYLEATHQLNNDDFIFTYGGQYYQWADPPDELRKEKNPTHKSSQGAITLKPIHIGLYFSFLLAIAGLLIIFILTYI